MVCDFVLNLLFYYVLPEFRNKGIYRKLYNYVLDESKKNSNVCGIRVTSFET